MKIESRATRGKSEFLKKKTNMKMNAKESWLIGDLLPLNSLHWSPKLLPRPPPVAYNPTLTGGARYFFFFSFLESPARYLEMNWLASTAINHRKRSLDRPDRRLGGFNILRKKKYFWEITRWLKTSPNVIQRGMRIRKWICNSSAFLLFQTDEKPSRQRII